MVFSSLEFREIIQPSLKLDCHFFNASPRIYQIGLSYKSSPIEVRERFSLGPDQQNVLYKDFQRAGMSSLLLDTCNRTEIYLSSDRPMSQVKLKAMQAWAKIKDLDTTMISEHTSSREDDEAVMHFFRVVSGLESMILGEGQILNQVKLCYAQAQGFTDALLNQLVQRALATGKKVRTQTEIAKGAMSVPAAALQAIQQKLAPVELRESKIMLLGSGQVAELCLEFLQSQGVGEKLTLIVRTESLPKLVHHRAGAISDYTALSRLAGSQDVILVCTSAPGYVLKPEHLMNSSQPVLVCDMSVPRNVDPAVHLTDGVDLIDLDYLKSVVEHNHLQRSNQSIKAEYIIAGEMKKFEQWRQKAEARMHGNLSA